MPIQIDPGGFGGTQKLDTVIFTTGILVPVVARFNPSRLAVKWIVSFLTSQSSTGFTVALALDDPLNIVDVEQVGAGGFQTSNFSDILVFPGSTVIAVVQPTPQIQQIILGIWGHMVPVK
jgi:hypothetical protein